MVSPLEQILLNRYNQPFVSAVLAAISAQAIKAIIAWITGREKPWVALNMAGGMPSAHSALALALFSSVVWQQGWQSTTTGVAGIVAVLVLYDAAVIRRAVEEQTLAIEFLMKKVAPERLGGFKAPRSMGHTVLEVLVGCVLGILVAHFVVWAASL